MRIFREWLWRRRLAAALWDIRHARSGRDYFQRELERAEQRYAAIERARVWVDYPVRGVAQ